MSDEKEVKLVVPKSLIVALWLIAGGLIANAVPHAPIERTWAASDLRKYTFSKVYVKLVGSRLH